METKQQQPETQKQTQQEQPVQPQVKAGPCVTQVKEYTQCLQSLSYYWSHCASEQKAFKACPEFDAWLEGSVRQMKKQ